ncbi:hypothetical protein Tco_0560942 [Tanacetum coccineum]
MIMAVPRSQVLLYDLAMRVLNPIMAFRSVIFEGHTLVIDEETNVVDVVSFDVATYRPDVTVGCMIMEVAANLMAADVCFSAADLNSLLWSIADLVAKSIGSIYMEVSREGYLEDAAETNSIDDAYYQFQNFLIVFRVPKLIKRFSPHKLAASQAIHDTPNRHTNVGVRRMERNDINFLYDTCGWEGKGHKETVMFVYKMVLLRKGDKIPEWLWHVTVSASSGTSTYDHQVCSTTNGICVAKAIRFRNGFGLFSKPIYHLRWRLQIGADLIGAGNTLIMGCEK